MGFLSNLEGALISSAVSGGAFIARVRAICVGLNSSAHDCAEWLPSSDFCASSILAATKEK